MATDASLFKTLPLATPSSESSRHPGTRRSLWDSAREMLSAPGGFSYGRSGMRRRAMLAEQQGTLAEYLAIPLCRTTQAAYRILHADDLTPASGAADFLNAVSLWAEAHPDRTVELCWAGEGDLRGVLRAQPLPPNVQQSFTGALTPAHLAGHMAISGLLAAPCLGRSWPPHLLEAMAAGLLVLGSRRNPVTSSLVVHNTTGWLFDPHAPQSMAAALNAAFSLGTGPLDAMRALARTTAIAFQDRPGPRPVSPRPVSARPVG